MAEFEKRCNLYDRCVTESAFNLHCKCKSCNRPQCDGCETYKQKINNSGLTKQDQRNLSNCMQCITCSNGR
ncbi:MAG: hypothetical protein MJ156_03210 [Alphaproteobacteria bacterium]|nr:hypothetical protein [Alphaproteobacteria bacterium]